MLTFEGAQVQGAQAIVDKLKVNPQLFGTKESQLIYFCHIFRVYPSNEYSTK
jgi:hypothetical protein